MKAKDIRRGNVIIHKNVPHRVMDFHHHTPGNLRAMVHVKLRNVLSGTQTEVRYSSGDELTLADIYARPATFLYSDANGFHFMDTENYEEIALSADLVSDARFYLQESMSVEISTLDGNPIGISIPQTVVLEIADTEPMMKGATASSSNKPATTTTGLQLTVPPFIKIGDKVLVNTEENKYLSRADT